MDGIGIIKCAILIMKRGKGQMKEGIELPNKKTQQKTQNKNKTKAKINKKQNQKQNKNKTKNRTLGVKETCKYLVILEADTIKQAEIK